MGRLKKIEGAAGVTVRFDDDTIAALDEWVEELHQTIPGAHGITRTSLVHDLVVRGIKERRTKAKEGKPKK